MLLGRQWDKLMRHELNHLASVLWPAAVWHKWIGFSNIRFRSKIDGNEVVWWVERDIPPYDRYRCAAYEIRMHLNAQGDPDIWVRSGEHTYPVLEIAQLSTLLDQAGGEAPLIIPRQMGAAEYD